MILLPSQEAQERKVVMTVTQGDLTQEKLEEMAKEQGITVDELQEKLKSDTDLDDEEITALLEKHQSDPKALAKALKSSRQEVAKKELEAKKEREVLEDENLRLKEGKKKEEIDPKDIRGMLRKKLKPVYNAETGEWETSDEALETIGMISDRIASSKVKPIMERMASSAIREQKSDLKNLPHFKELESEIDALLAKMPIEQRMQEGSVLAVYKYAIGEKTITDAQAKANQRPGIDGDITPHKSSGTQTSLPKKLSPEQLAEWDRTWKAKSYDEEDYLDLLNRMIEQDKTKGFKVKRTLIGQTVSN